MKKLLSILCTLALVLGVVLVPGMFSVSAEVTYLTPTHLGRIGATKDFDGVTAYGYENTEAQNKSTMFAFDYELKDNTDYYISFDFIGIKDSSPVRVWATNDPNNPKTNGPGGIRLASVGNSHGELMLILLTSFARWGYVFNTSGITNENNKYLWLEMFFVHKAAWIANITINEVPADTAENLYARKTRFIYTEKEDNEFVYTYRGYTPKSLLTFDYKLDADKNYKLSFDFYGKNRAEVEGQGSEENLWRVGATDAKDSYNISTSGKVISSVVGKYTDDWKSYTFEFKGSDVGVTSGNKYFAIFAPYIPATVKFKNIKLEVVEGGEGEGGGDYVEPSEPEEPSEPGENASNPLKDPQYIYPNKLSGAAKESADDMVVYKWDDNWQGSSVVNTGIFRPTYGWDNESAQEGVLTFDVQLEAGAEYILEFDRRGHYNAADSVVVGTADANGNADFTKSASETLMYALQWGNFYWHDSITFKSSDVINGDKKYLAVKLTSSAEKHKLKNFKLSKVTRDNSVIYPVNYGYSMSQIAENGGVTYAQTDATSRAWLLFDYKLEAGKTYQIEFDYFGHTNTAGGWSWKFGAAASLDVAATEKSEIFNTKSVFVNVPYVSGSHSGTISNKGYKHVTVMLNADNVITDTNKYLVIHSSNYDSIPFLKNFKVQEFSPKGTLPVKLGNETTISIEEGDVVVGVTASYSGHAWMKFDYELKPDTEYLLSYDFRGHTWVDESKGGVRLALFAVDDPYSNTHPKEIVNLEKNVPEIAVSQSTTKFTHKVVTFNGNDLIDGNKKYLCIYGSGHPEKWTFKNIVIIEKPKATDGNAIINGSFDEEALGTSLWNADGTVINRVTTENHTEGGNGALNVKGESFKNVSQMVILESNTNYEVSFWYKGNVGKQAFVGVSRDAAEFTSRYLITYNVAEKENTNEWTKATFTFNSGNYQLFNLAFFTNANSNYYIDDVTIAVTNKQSDVSANETVTDPTYNFDDKLLRYWHYDPAEGKNLIENSDFEGEIPASWGDFISGSNGVLSVVDGEGYAGTNSAVGGKALKFEAKGLEEKAVVSLYVDGLKPNTNYLLTYWIRSPLWSPDNTADVIHGISNVYDGGIYYTYREQVRGWHVGCNDNMWHRTTVQFNSGDNTRVAYTITGANTTFYLDNLMIFATDDKVDSRPQVIKDVVYNQPTVTDKAPTKIYVSDSKNLVKNGDFEDENSTFWNDKETTIGYEYENTNGYYKDKYVAVGDWNGTAVVKNTETSRGNALYYKANLGVTGRPLGTAYIKYIDVEPNTEYTFVADYIVTEYYDNPGVLGDKGNYAAGDFGIAAVNNLNPMPIVSVNFKDNYNANLTWQKLVVSFNSNGYSQVGIYVRDRGGEAYFDNISLFKTTDGSATPVEEEADAVEGEIKSNKYTVSGNSGSKIISGIKAGTTVKDVLDSLEGKNYIKVFDSNGNEVKDVSNPVGTGFSFRYMDGFTSVDAATVIIRGDVNGDGLVNGDDLSILLKNIISPLDYSVNDLQRQVGDIDGDGYITSHDIALISMHIGGVKALEPIVVA